MITFCESGTYRNWQSTKSWQYRWREVQFFILIQMILLVIPIQASADYNYDSYGAYDYYGDYDGVQQDSIYVDSGTNSIGDYDYRDGIVDRPKKRDAAQESNPKDANTANVCATPIMLPDAPTPCPPPVRTTECPPQPEPTTATTCEPEEETTTCEPGQAVTPAPTACLGPDADEKAAELRDLIQHLYISQARVQLEASEIKKAQAIANEAQQQLEESANHVRAVTAALQNAQREVATSAIRAQTAQLQLAAHDQLLFAARQDVDALSSRMVGLQAAEGIAQPKYNFDVSYLMNRLHQPLANPNKPKPIPTIALPPRPLQKATRVKKPSEIAYYDYEYDGS